jgi:hypothetical protein
MKIFTAAAPLLLSGLAVASATRGCYGIPGCPSMWPVGGND